MNKVTILHVGGEISKLSMNKEYFHKFLKWLEDDQDKKYFYWESYNNYYIFKQGIAKVIIERPD